MGTRNKLTGTRGEGGERKGEKKGKGLIRKTSINDPQTWTTVW